MREKLRNMLHTVIMQGFECTQTARKFKANNGKNSDEFFKIMQKRYWKD